ncbi:hypothetical protein RIF29_21318 [Crotalaria pallida]|uniref:Uncharacterized protein n=1 Tax=Crotalaria pallida TaxID=3830 RepID=A0AAN9IDA4_CROPI
MKIQKWREALNNAADLSGWHLKPDETYEHKFINKIVESVYKKISRWLYNDQNAAQHDNSLSIIQSQQVQGQPNVPSAGYVIPSSDVGVSNNTYHHQTQQWQQYSQPTQRLMSTPSIPDQPVYPSSSSYHTSVPPPQSQQSVPDLSNRLSNLNISGATHHTSYSSSQRSYSLPTFQSSQRQYHQPVQQPTSRLLGFAYPAPSSHQTSSSSYHTSVPPPQSQQSVPDLSNHLSSLTISGATHHTSYISSQRSYSLPTFQSSQRQYHRPVQQPMSRLLGFTYPAPSSHQTSSSSYHTSVPPPQSQQSVPNLSNHLSSLTISGATPHTLYSLTPF